LECLAVTKLPEGPEWIYQIKLDGYRAVAINTQYPYIVEALGDLPENTVVDGEIVALHDSGRPDFSLLQHSRSQASRICYFIFDLLICQNRDLTRLPYIQRRRKAQWIMPQKLLIFKRKGLGRSGIRAWRLST
jgi:ATP-dependent DNA ligase